MQIWRNVNGDLIIEWGSNIGKRCARYTLAGFCESATPAPEMVNSHGNTCRVVGEDAWAVIYDSAQPVTLSLSESVNN